MLFKDQLNLMSSSKTILEETIFCIPSLEFFQHYLHGITIIWNLIVSSVILSALLIFTCPLQVCYDLTLALFEFRSSHSSISLSFNTYAFRFGFSPKGLYCEFFLKSAATQHPEYSSSFNPALPTSLHEKLCFSGTSGHHYTMLRISIFCVPPGVTENEVCLCACVCLCSILFPEEEE